MRLQLPPINWRMQALHYHVGCATKMDSVFLSLADGIVRMKIAG